MGICDIPNKEWGILVCFKNGPPVDHKAKNQNGVTTDGAPSDFKRDGGHF